MTRPSWRPISLAWGLFCLVSLLGVGLVWPQEPLGVVTALQGTAQLSRPALPTPVALRFKGGLLLRDVVDTSERSMLRLLFGGKSTVTVRELSRLEVHEETLPTGGRSPSMSLTPERSWSMSRDDCCALAMKSKSVRPMRWRRCAAPSSACSAAQT